jgi:hypothetical protein
MGSNAGSLFQLCKILFTTWIVAPAAVQVDTTALQAFAAAPLTVGHGVVVYCRG